MRATDLRKSTKSGMVSMCRTQKSWPTAQLRGPHSRFALPFSGTKSLWSRWLGRRRPTAAGGKRVHGAHPAQSEQTQTCAHHNKSWFRNARDLVPSKAHQTAAINIHDEWADKVALENFRPKLHVREICNAMNFCCEEKCWKHTKFVVH